MERALRAVSWLGHAARASSATLDIAPSAASARPVGATDTVLRLSDRVWALLRVKCRLLASGFLLRPQFWPLQRVRRRRAVVLLGQSVRRGLHLRSGCRDLRGVVRLCGSGLRPVWERGASLLRRERLRGRLGCTAVQHLRVGSNRYLPLRSLEVCQACGGEGERCCSIEFGDPPISGVSCDDGFYRDLSTDSPSGRCKSAGCDIGDVCCFGDNRLRGWSRLHRRRHLRRVRRRAGQPCCIGNTCNSDRLVCDPDGGICVACGGPNQRCCAGGFRVSPLPR